MDNQQRRPSGTPSGGQFSGRTNSESSVALGGPTPEQVEALYNQVNASAQYYGRKHGADVDELATKLLMEVSMADPAKYSSGAYVHTVARQISAKMISGNSNGPDFEADRDFRRRRDDWEQAHACEMPSKMRDELAESIRQNQPPRRRARKGFHHAAPKSVSLDVAGEESPYFFHEAFRAEGADAGLDGADSPAFNEVAAAATAEAEGKWAALADVYGAPRAMPRSITEMTAVKIRRHVKDLGGAGYVATAFLNGEISEDGAESLFVPFGGRTLNINDQNQIAKTIARLQQGPDGASHADLAFSDAVRVATRSKQRAKRVWRKAPAAQD